MESKNKKKFVTCKSDFNFFRDVSEFIVSSACLLVALSVFSVFIAESGQIVFI